MKLILHIALLLSCLGMNLSANIQTYGFGCITNNMGGGACGVSIAPQMFVDVIGGTTTSAVVGTAPPTTIGANQVLFRFRNVGSNNSSITDVYFDDGTLLAISSVVNGSIPGVNFSAGAFPRDLPGGNAVDFDTTAGFSADSNPPVQPRGVNPGEELGILFDLQGSQTYASVVNSMSLSVANPGVDVLGGLRIGIHVQGISGGFSESLVNGVCTGSCNDDVVPEPGFYGLLATGLVGLAFTAKKIRRRSAE